MNIKQLADDARALNLTVEIVSGRVRIEGKTSEVRRAFAIQGCDLVAQGTTGHAVYLGAEHSPATFVATICSTSPGYAYGYTASA